MDITIEKVQSAIDKLRFPFPYSAEEWAENLYMENYHCHKDFTNLNVIDCAESIENYAERTKEYGAKCLFSGEHGSQGNQFHVYKVAEQNGLKYRHSCEAYWVRSRHEKDRTNCHMMIVAKNPEGRKDLNYILSVAQESGYYYQPRIDLELLLSVKPENFIISSSCLAGWKYEDSDEIWLKIAKHFGDNFFIEVQNHNTDKQKKLNAHLVEFAKENNLQLICGLDSHYVLEENRAKREWIQKYKKIEYNSDEDGWYMDYPETTEVIKRFEQQGVLSEAEILEAVLNTNIFVNECEEIEFDRHFKIPNIYPELDYEGRVKKLKQIVTQEYKKDPNKSKEKKEGIRWEVNQYVESGTVDYPLMSKAIVDLAVGEFGAVITRTSRGSAASFFTNKLMHLTTVDRFNAEVPIYPERFLTKERILSGSLPDVDTNCAQAEPLVLATRKLLGEHSCYPMLAVSKLQEKAAWKLYAGSQNIEPAVANSVSKSIDQYNDAVKHSDGTKEIRIEDYIPAEYLEIYKESRSYQGIAIGATPHPCGNLVFDGDIRREIGLMSVKSESKKERTLVAAVEGKYLDEFGYVKEDFLIVDTVALTEKLFQSIGKPTPSFTELKEMVKGDKATWDIYAKGITCCVNQCEQEGTRKKAMKYKPQTIGELAAFIAGVRPGFASLINNFLNRRPYTTGEPKIDKLLEDSSHYLLYQESIMKVLGFLGLEMGETYQTIKAISKKKLKGQMKEDLMKKLKESWMKEFGNLDNFEKVWKVINDAAKYSFNSCVAGDTKLFQFGKNGRFHPTVEEMYRIKNDLNYALTTGHKSLRAKYRRDGYPSCLSLDEQDSRIRKNRIINITQKGIKPIYRVMAKNGSFVDCTMEHKFPTINGEYKKLEDLKIGDLLIVKGEYEKSKFDTSLSRWKPAKGNLDISNSIHPNRFYGDSVMFHMKYKRMIEQNQPCEICGRKYEAAHKFELHHIDHDRKNNSPDNLQWLCNSCHKKEHYKSGRTKAGEKGYPAETSPIISIEYLRDDMTYDITMDDPNHTFVTESGLVVCNCHAYSMAGDSLYNAWFKAHHTAKFYEVAIGHYQEKDKKEKIDALIREAMECYGFSYGDYRFGVDNRKVTVDEENKVINPNLSSVKGIGEKVAEELYQISLEKPESFYEIEKLISQSSINKTVMEKLIKLDYFKQFARRNKLLEFHKFYTLFGKAKSVKFKKIDDNGYSRELFIPYGKVSETQVSKIDIDECIKHYWDSLPDMLTQPEDAIRWEFEITGIVSYTNSDIPENVYFVTDIECKKKLGIASLYAPNDGEKRTVKFWISNFNSHPFEMGDFLTIPYFDQKQVREFTGETDPVTGKRIYAAIPGKYENFLGPYTVHKEVVI